MRRQSGRLVITSWALCACATLFAVANSSDFSRLQWPAAMLAGFLTFIAIVLTLVHCVAVVPSLWYAKRKSRPPR